MKNNTIAIVAILIVIILVISLVSLNNPSIKTGVNSPQAPILNEPTRSTIITPKEVTPPSGVVIIEIKNFTFNPNVLTIKVGTKVMWINNDDVPHTVTSNTGSQLDSANLSPRSTFSAIFMNPGQVSYHCKIHPTMKGTIVVE